MPRYTFIKHNDGEPDADMLADTAGIDCDVCKNCHDGRNRWRCEAFTAIACAADVLFHKYGSKYPDYDDLICEDYRCGLCNAKMRGRDNSEAHYTQ